jgi:opine dehydrogenase
MATERDDVWAVIGGGMGGKGLAAQLGSDGRRVRIHDIDERAIAGIKAAGGLHVEGGARGFAPVEHAGTDIAAILDGADFILVCTYGNAHGEVARQVAPHLRDRQVVVLIQGHFGGALVFREALRRAGCAAQVDVGEMDSYPYMLTVLAPDRVLMASVKQHWQLAVAPASRTGAAFERISDAFPGMTAARSVLDTGFLDLGGLFHAGGMVTNVGRVERGERYDFYAANMVPSVCRVIEAMDRERVAVARAFGVEAPDARSWLASTYGMGDRSLYECLQEMAVTHYRYAPAPNSLEHRYVVQDVGCVLVPIVALAAVAGVPAPVSDAVVRIASALTGRDFFEEGRNLRQLGLDGLGVAEILASVRG